MKHAVNVGFSKIESIKEANEKIFSKKINKINTVIFVYTPIKVGSTTLVSSIRLSACDKFIVAHLHDEISLQVLTGINSVSIQDIIRYNQCIGKKVYVIDVYRSPIERKMSDFFEKMELHFNNSPQNINKYHINRVIERFNNIFPYVAKDDYYFEKYGITPPPIFDHKKKYLLLRENNIFYIKLRLKDSSEWSNILTTILGEKIYIINDYETTNKPIYELYKRFKEQYRLPVNYFEMIKNCKYLNYYYSEGEKIDYFKGWSTRLMNNYIPYKVEEYKLYEKITVENMCFSTIQLEHYIDNGCLCKACSAKRADILHKHRSGKKIDDKINHVELVKELTREFVPRTRNNEVALKVNNQFSERLKIKLW